MSTHTKRAMSNDPPPEPYNGPDSIRDSLYKIARILSASGTLEGKTREVLRELTRVSGADVAVLRIPDEEHRNLSVLACVPENYNDDTMDQPLPIKGTLMGGAFRKGNTLVVNDYPNHPNAQPRFIEWGLAAHVMLPVKAEGTTLGIIAVNSFNIGHFTDERVNLLTAISNGIGVLLHNAQLAESDRQRAVQQEALFKIATTLSGPGRFHEKAERLLTVLMEVVRADEAILRVPDDQHRNLRIEAFAREKFDYPLLPEQLPIEGTLSGRVFQSAKPAVVNNYQAHELALPEHKDYPLGSIASLPVISDDRTLGVIVVSSASENHFTPERVRLLTAIANGMGPLFDNARLNEELQTSLGYQTALLEASRTISTSLDTHEILSALAHAICEGLNATSAHICDWDEETGLSTVLAEYRSSTANEKERVSELGGSYDLRKDFAPIDRFLGIDIVHLAHVDDPDVPVAGRENLIKFGGKSVLTVNFTVNGRVYGYIEVWESRQRREFTKDEIALAQGLARHAGNVLEKAQLHEEIQKTLRQQTALLEASRSISTALDTQSILTALTRVLCDGLDATSAYICDWDEESGLSTVLTEYLSSSASDRERVSDLGESYDLRKDFGGLGRRLESGGVDVMHVDDPDLIASEREVMLEFGAQSVLSVALAVGGQEFGYVEIYESRRRREFTEEEFSWPKA